jgi:hypothetical protein
VTETIIFVSLRAPGSMTGESATFAFHRGVLEREFGYRVREIVPRAAPRVGTSLVGRATVQHLHAVRSILREQPGVPVIWFVPAAAQVPLVSLTLRGLSNPSGVVVEGAPFLRIGDWRRTLAKMSAFFLIRACANHEALARVPVGGPPLTVTAASRWQVDRMRGVLPDARLLQLPNGSPGLTIRQRWLPPPVPTIRVMGHGLFYKGIDLLLEATDCLVKQVPDLVVGGALPTIHPNGLPQAAGRPYLRLHGAVTPYEFLAGATLAAVPLRVSSGTNVYPNTHHRGDERWGTHAHVGPAATSRAVRAGW